MNCYSVGKTARELEVVYNEHTKRRILFFHAKVYRAPTITKWLGDEGIVVNKQGVGSFLAHAEKTGSIGRRPGSGRPSKQTDGVRETIERTMRADDETTVQEVWMVVLSSVTRCVVAFGVKKLTSQGNSLSKSTVLRCRRSLGWTVRGSTAIYHQLVRSPIAVH